MTLRGLLMEELLKKLMEEGIDVSDDEAQRFRDNDVDGETVDCGLTETMVAYLFDKSFKKQLKFRDFTNRYKEVIITLQPVDPFEGTVEGPVSQANQTGIQQLLSEETEALSRKSSHPQPLRAKDSCFVGEDAASVDAHIKVLNDQHRTLHPDTALVKDRMTKTFAWRRREVAEGMCTVDLLKRDPFLGTSAGLCDEVDLMHPCQDNICCRFSENFTAVLQMTKDLPLKKVYMEARENALAEDITGNDIVLTGAAMSEKQREPKESQDKIQQRVQYSEKHLKMLEQEVETFNQSADKAVRDSEEIFTEVKQRIRARQKSEVSHVYELKVKLASGDL
ncbi:unnamed protein product [Oreochromis niloticus]|nr:unnamed protein product [Mustela putorius furo]